VSGGYKVVTDLYGRGEIHTRFALDARRGPAQEARFAYTESFDIAIDADLTGAFASEIQRNGELAARSETVAAAVGVDTKNWRFTRVLLSTKEPNRSEVGVSYQILHLSPPLLDKLPKGDDR
jgi:hypothetical protein